MIEDTEAVVPPEIAHDEVTESLVPNGVYKDLRHYFEIHRIKLVIDQDIHAFLKSFGLSLTVFQDNESGTPPSLCEQDHKLHILTTQSAGKLITHELIDISELVRKTDLDEAIENLPCTDCLLVSTRALISAKERGGEGIKFKRLLIAPSEDSDEVTHSREFYFNFVKNYIGFSSLRSTRDVASLWHELGHSWEPKEESDKAESLLVNRVLKIVENSILNHSFDQGILDDVESEIGMDYFFARYLKAQSERNASEWAYADLSSASDELALDSDDLRSIWTNYEELWQTYDTYLLPFAGVSDRARAMGGQEMVDTVNDMLEVYQDIKEACEYLGAAKTKIEVVDQARGQSFSLELKGLQACLWVTDLKDGSLRSYYLSPFFDFEETVRELGHTQDYVTGRQVITTFSAFLPDIKSDYSPDDLQAIRLSMQRMMDLVDTMTILYEDVANTRWSFLDSLYFNARGGDPLGQNRLTIHLRDQGFDGTSDSLRKILAGESELVDARPLSRLEVIALNVIGEIARLLGVSVEQFASQKFNQNTGAPLVTSWDKLVVASESYLRDHTGVDVDILRQTAQDPEQYCKDVISNCFTIVQNLSKTRAQQR